MRPIFLPYVSIADMLTQTFGSDCEVVLHDLNDPEHSVVYVSNGTINLDTTLRTQQIAFMQSFLPDRPKPKQPPQSEHISAMIENLMDNILSGCDVQSLSREARIAKVRFMDEKGVFLMKGSIEKAAEKLGVNKVTIYSYLDEARGKRR